MFWNKDVLLWEFAEGLICAWGKNWRRWIHSAWNVLMYLHFCYQRLQYCSTCWCLILKAIWYQVYLTAFWTFVLLQVKVKVRFHCVKSRPDASWMQWSLNLSVVGHMTWACPGQLLCVQCFLLTNQSSGFPTMFNSVQPHLEYCVELWAPQY